MYAALNLARSSLQFKKKFVNEGAVINFDSESMRVIDFQTPSDTKQEMRPLFFCGWPLNFPIRDGVFNYSYNLGSQSILILFISMQICGVTGRAPLT